MLPPSTPGGTMNQTTSSTATSGESTSHGLAEPHVAAQAEASDSFPPRRISTLPPLDNHEQQDRFLRSPSAVLESIGLRVPAALAQHITRRSSPPPAMSAAPVAAETAA